MIKLVIMMHIQQVLVNMLGRKQQRKPAIINPEHYIECAYSNPKNLLYQP